MTAIFQVDPVGGRGGMYYYDFALCQALKNLGADVVLVTSEETRECQLPHELDVRFLFQGLYGDRPLWIRGKNYLQSLYRIFKSLKATPGGIVHQHFFQVPAFDLALVSALKKRSFGFVVTAHDVVPFDARLYTTQFLNKIYRQADRIIVHAEKNREELLARFQVETQKVVIIPHGNYTPFIDKSPVTKDVARKKLGLPATGKVILFFGQIKKVKGLEYLLKAMPAVIEAVPEVHLVIAGRVWKDDFSGYADLIRSLGLEDKVTSRIEYIPDSDAPYYFYSSDLVALPYTRIYQSGVLLMAHSYGIPVVATAIGGLKEVVQDGVSGFLVPPEDPGRLSKAIIRLLRDDAAAKIMGEAGRAHVIEHYSWDEVAERTLRVYAEVEASL